MLVKKIGPDGLERERELDITQEEWDDYHVRGELATIAFPNLTNEEILFVQTGLYEKEFQEVSENPSSQ